MLQKQEANQKLLWAPPSLFGSCLFHFLKDNQMLTHFALESQASNLKTRKLKKIGIDMEDAIFIGVQ